jgi:hypothetical protein
LVAPQPFEDPSVEVIVPDEDDAKLALANLMIRKAGLIRTIRHEMQKQGVVYWAGLTEILEAIERAKKQE